MTPRERSSGPRTGGPGTLGVSEHNRSSGSRADRLVRQRARRTSGAPGRVSRADSALVDRARPGRQPTPPTVAPPALQPLPATVEADGSTKLDLREEFGGARLLVSDIRLAFMLVNEARYRTLGLIGVPRDQANVATLVAIIMAADAIESSKQALGHAPHLSRADAVLGAAATNELLHAIGGAPTRKSPLFGPLVAFALLAALSRPALSRSVDGMRALSHDARLSLKHRYGHRTGPARMVEREFDRDAITPTTARHVESAG